MSKITNIANLKHLDKFPDFFTAVKTIAKDLSDSKKVTKIIEIINNMSSMKDYKPPTFFKTGPQFENINVVINGEKVGQLETWHPTQKNINISTKANFMLSQPKLRQNICKAKQLCLFPHEFTFPIIVNSMEILKKFENRELNLLIRCPFCKAEIIYKGPEVIKFIEDEGREHFIYFSKPTGTIISVF